MDSIKPGYLMMDSPSITDLLVTDVVKDNIPNLSTFNNAWLNTWVTQPPLPNIQNSEEISNKHIYSPLTIKEFSVFMDNIDFEDEDTYFKDEVISATCTQSNTNMPPVQFRCGVEKKYDKTIDHLLTLTHQTLMADQFFVDPQLFTTGKVTPHWISVPEKFDEISMNLKVLQCYVAELEQILAPPDGMTLIEWAQQITGRAVSSINQSPVNDYDNAMKLIG